MKDMEEGDNAWLRMWFKEVRPWSPLEVDKERLMWLKVFGVLFQAWNHNLFDLISKQVGALIREEEGTKNQSRMDVERIQVRTKSFSMINEEIRIKVNDDIFNILMIEDTSDVEVMMNKKLIYNSLRVDNESSLKDFVNESGNAEEGSELDCVPETASNVGDGGGPESERNNNMDPVLAE